ncbi:MAG: alkane 1-monooxygenase [Proteobacteria bacterium]|nr:alkane 1-monooxygenase [Pseudomonadota bacterium]MDA1057227.1 alkane 1-monooxygenase [Pseudomonadota bacterium]
MLRFALAYVIPGATLLGLALGGWWTWLALAQSYVLFPVFDALVPADSRNPDADQEGALSSRLAYRILTASAVPIQIGVILAGGFFITAPGATTIEIVGATIAVGISSGAFAIVAGHELMHQRRFERGLSRVLMASVMYAHFCVEHVQGHHVHVATPHDPASAPRGQGLYRFLVRTTVGSWRSAWRIEAARLKRKGRLVLHPTNRMLQDAALTVAVSVGAALLWGWLGVVYFLAQGAIAVLQLETINYIEHYGLRRRETAPGKFEAADARHSWNTNRRLTNLALFNLGRHTDHHNFAGRRYQILRHEPAAPQLPSGYAATMLLAFVPPLWRRVMDPRVDAAMGPVV